MKPRDQNNTFFSDIETFSVDWSPEQYGLKQILKFAKTQYKFFEDIQLHNERIAVVESKLDKLIFEKLGVKLLGHKVAEEMEMSLSECTYEEIEKYLSELGYISQLFQDVSSFTDLLKKIAAIAAKLKKASTELLSEKITVEKHQWLMIKLKEDGCEKSIKIRFDRFTQNGVSFSVVTSQSLLLMGWDIEDKIADTGTRQKSADKYQTIELRLETSEEPWLCIMGFTKEQLRAMPEFKSLAKKKNSKTGRKNLREKLEQKCFIKLKLVNASSSRLDLLPECLDRTTEDISVRNERIDGSHDSSFLKPNNAKVILASRNGDNAELSKLASTRKMFEQLLPDVCELSSSELRLNYRLVH